MIVGVGLFVLILAIVLNVFGVVVAGVNLITVGLVVFLVGIAIEAFLALVGRGSSRWFR